MAGAVRISPDDLVDVLAKIAKDDNLQVSVKQSAKGGVIAGTGATVGGLLGGPIGIAVGATLGKYILCLTKYPVCGKCLIHPLFVLYLFCSTPATVVHIVNNQ